MRNVRKPPVPTRRPSQPPVAAAALVDEAHRCVAEDMSQVSTLLALASKYEQDEEGFLAQSSRSDHIPPPQATKEAEYREPRRQSRELRPPRTPLASYSREKARLNAHSTGCK